MLGLTHEGLNFWDACGMYGVFQADMVNGGGADLCPTSTPLYAKIRGLSERARRGCGDIPVSHSSHFCFYFTLSGRRLQHALGEENSPLPFHLCLSFMPTSSNGHLQAEVKAVSLIYWAADLILHERPISCTMSTRNIFCWDILKVWHESQLTVLTMQHFISTCSVPVLCVTHSNLWVFDMSFHAFSLCFFFFVFFFKKRLFAGL